MTWTAARADNTAEPNATTGLSFDRQVPSTDSRRHPSVRLPRRATRVFARNATSEPPADGTEQGKPGTPTQRRPFSWRSTDLYAELVTTWGAMCGASRRRRPSPLSNLDLQLLVRREEATERCCGSDEHQSGDEEGNACTEEVRSGASMQIAEQSCGTDSIHHGGMAARTRVRDLFVSRFAEVLDHRPVDSAARRCGHRLQRQGDHQRDAKQAEERTPARLHAAPVPRGGRRHAQRLELFVMASASSARRRNRVHPACDDDLL